MKKYKVGFFGGKFMPFHKGHLYCLQKAIKDCEKVYLLMMVNGNQEQEILAQDNSEYLMINERLKQLERGVELLHAKDVVTISVVDVGSCRDADGGEDWDAETPLVRAVCGDRIDAVYGSEPSYGAYFSRAYPEAKYILVDVNRETVNISGTKCRNMSEEERKQWII